MITAVHIEDEPRNIELLQSLLTTYCCNSIDYKGAAKNVGEAFELIKNKKPQLVFLDIELNNGNAFELLEKIDSTIGIDFEVIFITAFNDYAIKAFRLNAIDYLLKPITIAELKQAVEKAMKRINTSEKSENNVMSILKQLNDNVVTKKIGITVADGVVFIKVDDIIKLEAKGSYTILHLTTANKITCTKGIGDIEASLPENLFVRVHNAWIVNTRHLKKYIKGRNGYLEMDDGSVVPVSVRKKGSFLDII